MSEKDLNTILIRTAFDGLPHQFGVCTLTNSGIALSVEVVTRPKGFANLTPKMFVGSYIWADMFQGYIATRNNNRNLTGE